MAEDAAATVLIVDDDVELLNNTSMILSLNGFEVFTAHSGQRALEMLRAGECAPQVIVSDILMPGLNGFDLLERVRTMPELKLIPFIFLSAHDSRRSISEGRQRGADDYITKPFDARELIQAIRHRVDRAHALREKVETEISTGFDRVRSQLVNLLSHELRTPLTYITGGFELLADSLRYEDLPPDAHTSLDLIRSGTQRLTRLAEQVVRYAELSSGHLRAHFAEFALLHSVNEVVTSAAALILRESGAPADLIQIDTQIPDTLEVSCIPEYLVNAIMEILRNALTYSPEGSTVTVRIYRRYQEVFIEISDQGRGIPADRVNRALDVMGQVDRTYFEQQGIGMGLPIVKRTMDVHGGECAIASVQDKGTTVTLKIPLPSISA